MVINFKQLCAYLAYLEFLHYFFLAFIYRTYEYTRMRRTYDTHACDTHTYEYTRMRVSAYICSFKCTYVTRAVTSPFFMCVCLLSLFKVGFFYPSKFSISLPKAIRLNLSCGGHTDPTDNY